jgi:hypothetical protein
MGENRNKETEQETNEMLDKVDGVKSNNTA